MAARYERTAHNNWVFRDPTEEPRIRVKRQWSLSGLFYPEYQLTSVDGDDIGQFEMGQEGLFYGGDVTLERSSIPPEIPLALVCGIFWAMNQS